MVRSPRGGFVVEGVSLAAASLDLRGLGFVMEYFVVMRVVVGLASRSSADWRSHSWLVAKYGIVCRSGGALVPSCLPFLLCSPSRSRAVYVWRVTQRPLE